MQQQQASSNALYNAAVLVGRLVSDKSVFDSSVDRGTPFSFTIGVGQVILGWDKGVMEMSVGEKVRSHTLYRFSTGLPFFHATSLLFLCVPLCVYLCEGVADHHLRLCLRRERRRSCDSSQCRFGVRS